MKQVKREYLKGELSSIQAIERLENLGYPPRSAEALIDHWDRLPEEVKEHEKARR